MAVGLMRLTKTLTVALVYTLELKKKCPVQIVLGSITWILSYGVWKESNTVYVVRRGEAHVDVFL